MHDFDLELYLRQSLDEIFFDCIFTAQADENYDRSE
jgi:hypothetical protein